MSGIMLIRILLLILALSPSVYRASEAQGPNGPEGAPLFYRSMAFSRPTGWEA